MTTQYVYTKVSATPDEEQTFHSPTGPCTSLGALSNTVHAYKVIHACALSHGLPEIPGYYGYDLEAHQFIRMPYEQFN